MAPVDSDAVEDVRPAECGAEHEHSGGKAQKWKRPKKHECSLIRRETNECHLDRASARECPLSFLTLLLRERAASDAPIEPSSGC